MQINRAIVGVALLCGACMPPTIANAVEGGGSLYLLGKRGPLAAFIPRPGVYLTNDVYYYDANRDDVAPFGDNLVGDIDVEALVNIAQFTWVTDLSLWDGRVAFSSVLPYGHVDVSGNAQVGLGGGGITRAEGDDVTNIGDPNVAAALGWKRRDGDRFRAWSTYAAVIVPWGDYEVGRLANVGKNRWGLDVGAAYTMANFKGGRELSSVLGVTFNGENDKTDYDSGNELHLEIAGKQHLPNHWSFGVVGYWNEQLTADSNNGPILGDFEGRVFGAGPELSYQFTQNKQRPITVDLRWYHEFEAEKRVEGDAVFLTISVPLSIQASPAPAKDWSTDERAQP